MNNDVTALCTVLLMRNTGERSRRSRDSTHILYVRYIILLQKGRQAEQKEGNHTGREMED